MLWRVCSGKFLFPITTGCQETEAEAGHITIDMVKKNKIDLEKTPAD